MPTIVILGNLKIQMFADDHNPPHFHVRTPDSKALVRISDLKLIAGSIDRRDLEKALAWARQNRKALEDAWLRFN
jgi:hypothetical protein